MLSENKNNNDNYFVWGIVVASACWCLCVIVFGIRCGVAMGLFAPDPKLFRLLASLCFCSLIIAYGHKVWGFVRWVRNEDHPQQWVRWLGVYGGAGSWISLSLAAACFIFGDFNKFNFWLTVEEIVCLTCFVIWILIHFVRYFIGKKRAGKRAGSRGTASKIFADENPTGN